MKKNALFIVLIILAAALCYANSLNNPLIWDQEVAILGNPLIRSWHYLPQVFTTNVEGRQMTSVSYYRPMEVISYMFDYSLWGFNPTGYHITSILLHIINALLIFFLLAAMGMSAFTSFLAALIFAVHPVNTSTVTYSIRGDLLATMFCLSCFIFFLKAKKHIIFSLLAVFTFLLALISKELAVVAAFLILFYSLLFLKMKYRQAVTVAVLVIFSAAYIIFRISLVRSNNYQALSLISVAPLWQRILTLPRIILTYLGLLVFPLNLRMEYLFVERTLFSPYILLGVPGLFCCAFLLIRHIRRLLPAEPKSARLLIFFLFWFFFGLAPFYNIIITLHATVYENWAYFSGIGFIVFAVFLFSRALAKKAYPALINMAKVAAVCLLFYYTATTVRRNFEWRDPEYLYRHDLKYEPNSFILHNNVGVLAFRRGDIKEAKKHFQEAIEVSPHKSYETAYNNLGVVYENENDSSRAEECYAKSIEVNNYELAYGNLSRLLLKQGRVREGIAVAQRGRDKFPFNPEISYYLGVGYGMDNNYPAAIGAFERLMSIDPGYKDTAALLEKARGGQ